MLLFELLIFALEGYFSKNRPLDEPTDYRFDNQFMDDDPLLSTGNLIGNN